VRDIGAKHGNIQDPAALAGPIDEKHESPITKATWIRGRGVWRAFWQSRELKWQGYKPRPQVKSVEEFASLAAKGRAVMLPRLRASCLSPCSALGYLRRAA
jgi:hypothetical protein